MSKIQLIPTPAQLKRKSGSFRLHAGVPIYHDESSRENAGYLAARLAELLGQSPKVQTGEQTGETGLVLETCTLAGDFGEEGYRLSITPEKIEITANTPAGIFYGIQSLLQIATENVILPCLEIEDWPRYPWRGYMLDEARHFQGIETVKAMLDEMAYPKLNRFHWHLVDDQGWRIEIRQYPKLTEVGGRRPGTVTKNAFTSKTHNHTPHEGWYTQDEIREVVAYAAERHIMVIPEIEMPGHSSAALAAYPEFSCRGKPVEVQTGFGIFADIFCGGKESTYTFLEHVLEEVVELFPAPYVHIGGDEAPKKRWKACPDCQRKIREEGLADEHALQTYMTNRISSFLKTHDKRIIFWSDSYSEEIDPDAVVHFWVGHRKEIAAALESGRQMINSTYLRTYLDHTYRLLTLKKTYGFKPRFEPISGMAAENILGLEGLMWGEWLPTRRRLDYQTFPRLAALAEAGWSRAERRSYPGFMERLPAYLAHLRQNGFSPATLGQANPPWYRRIFPHLTIAQPKTNTAREEDD